MRLLDETKPPYAENSHRDYLLATPFRYPPLHWGSRFGTIQEMSIFYGSHTQETAVAELTYYKLIFLEGIEGELLNRKVRTSYALVSAKYKFEPGMDLGRHPFAQHSEILRHKSNYQPTQILSTELHNMQGKYYTSARCPNAGSNVAILDPSGLTSKKPVETLRCCCKTTKDRVVIRVDRNQILEFSRKNIYLMKRFRSRPSPFFQNSKF